MPGSDIYALPILDNYLVFSPLNGFSALVNKKALAEIQGYLHPGGNNTLHYAAECTPEYVPELFSIIKNLSKPVPFSPEKSGPFSSQFLGIIPSRRCNMSCIYCDFDADNAEVMHPLLALSAVDFMAGHTEKCGKKSYTIQFFGGEPFIEDELVDTVVHHARFVAEKTGIIPFFEACTNGLFSEKRARFIGAYFDRIILSLDGREEMHNKTRPVNNKQGSFREVYRSARLLSSMDVELCIRCCITSDTVHKMEEIAEWLCSDIKPGLINFETLTDNTRTAKAAIFPPHPVDFARHLVRSFRIIRKYGIRPVYASLSLEKLKNSFCPLGSDALILLPDGKIAGCYLLPRQWEARGLDLYIGRVTMDGEITIDKEAVKRVRKLAVEKERCSRCFCRYSCAGGCHVNNTYPGCPGTYNDFCIHTRLITACILLEEMNLPAVCDTLLEDAPALERLAGQLSDNIGDIRI